MSWIDASLQSQGSMKAPDSSAVWLPQSPSRMATTERRARFVGLGVLLGLACLVLFGLNVAYMAKKLPELVVTIPLVLVISLWAVLLACLAGFLLALGLLSSRPALYVSARLYVSLFQGVPLVVVLFLLYFGLPHLNSTLLLTPVQAGILGLGLTNGAYLAEVFRSSILAVPQGQTEAAEALGMTDSQRMRRIVLPQAARLALPPTTNYYIFILKDSALVGFVGVAELFLTARSIGQRDFKVLEMLLLAGIVYWIITMALSAIQQKLERKMGTAYVRET